MIFWGIPEFFPKYTNGVTSGMVLNFRATNKLSNDTKIMKIGFWEKKLEKNYENDPFLETTK